jgi:type II secretory pathway pseudopilin PulG
MKRRGYQVGFTYLALLFFVATMGTILAITGMIWSTAQQRAKERQLLFIGNEYRKAITSYYQRTPGTIKRYPRTLDALLLDNRHLSTVRHLRRLYPDPLQPRSEWGLVLAPDGGIMGVYSLFDGVPIKRSQFKTRDIVFDGVTHYSGWRFIYEIPAEPKLAVGTSR